MPSLQLGGNILKGPGVRRLHAVFKSRVLGAANLFVAENYLDRGREHVGGIAGLRGYGWQVVDADFSVGVVLLRVRAATNSEIQSHDAAHELNPNKKRRAETMRFGHASPLFRAEPPCPESTRTVRPCRRVWRRPDHPAPWNARFVVPPQLRRVELRLHVGV